MIGLVWVVAAVGFAIAVAACVAFVQVATTRDDAFTAADRRPKQQWLAISGLAAVVLVMSNPLLGGQYVSFLGWIAMVVTGVYWFDVRPSIKDVLEGAGGW